MNFDHSHVYMYTCMYSLDVPVTVTDYREIICILNSEIALFFAEMAFARNACLQVLNEHRDVQERASEVALSEPPSRRRSEDLDEWIVALEHSDRSANEAVGEAKPDRLIDWILAPRGTNFLRYEVLQSDLSDHLPVIAEIALP